MPHMVERTHSTHSDRFRGSMNGIVKFLSGRSPKKSYLILMSIIIVVLLATNIFAILAYPRTYSFFRRSVSSLGNRLKNPDGHIIWSIGMCFAGLSLIPYALFLYQKFRPIARITSIVSTSILILSCIGIFGVGIFSEDAGWIHYIFALIAFFLSFVGFSFNMYTLIKSRKDKRGWPKIWQIVILYLITDLIMLGFLSAFSLYWIYVFWDLFWFNPLLPLWEWLLSGSYILHLYSLLFIIREK
ncbi:MAG: hypothetical protein ACTSYI_03240 [Promethearchaeota archaeon]